jgi:hypothetical protein
LCLSSLLYLLSCRAAASPDRFRLAVTHPLHHLGRLEGGGQDPSLKKQRSSESLKDALFRIRKGHAVRIIDLNTRVFSFKNEPLDDSIHEVFDLDQWELPGIVVDKHHDRCGVLDERLCNREVETSWRRK